jgi:predicted DNA-binding transcriptional regulator AlpA
MCTIELPELPNARDLQERCGVSCRLLERHIQGHGFPQPIKLGVRVGAVRHWHRSNVGQNTLQELVRPRMAPPGRAQ